MYAKNLYNNNHKLLTINVENWAVSRLHNKYKILFIVVLSCKLLQQYVELFKMHEKINNLT